MNKSNILTLNIQDRTTESTIKAELTNETMHKLCRIKELYNYNSLHEYEAYRKFYESIKAATQLFISNIDWEYLDAMCKVAQGTLKDDSIDELKLLDSLITTGYDYKDAVEKVRGYYDK